MGYARSKHLTPYDVLTIASMVEAEAETAHDRPLIASVIYNRLHDNMPLQIDATTRYATGNYTQPLTQSQLNSKSPYNTRIHKGLTPDPDRQPQPRLDPGRGASGPDQLPVLRREAVRQRRARLRLELQPVPRSGAALLLRPQRARRALADALLRPLADRTRLGVLGWPVAHSRSPQIQNAALEALGLTGWRYQLLPVPPDRFGETVRALAAAGFRGANVTIPHKQAALAVADTASASARAIGAANTLTFEDDGTIAADNTDAPAVVESLPFAPAGRTALVLGAGGSARAAVWALLDAGAAEVRVWNRTADRAARAGGRARRDRGGPRGARGSARQLHLGGNGRRPCLFQAATARGR